MKLFNQLPVLLTILFTVNAIAAEKIYFVHNDHLGSPETLTDENQTIVWQASQDPFWDSAPAVEQVGFDFRFPGQYYDVESGLVYNWNRYYDAGTGRYVTSDPIGLGGGLNTYGYVLANPLKYVDPEGLDVLCGQGKKYIGKDENGAIRCRDLGQPESPQCFSGNCAAFPNEVAPIPCEVKCNVIVGSVCGPLAGMAAEVPPAAVGVFVGCRLAVMESCLRDCNSDEPSQCPAE